MRSDKAVKRIKRVENKKCAIELDVAQAGNLLSVIVTSKERHQDLISVIGVLEEFVKENDPDKYDNICLKEFVESQNRRIC